MSAASVNQLHREKHVDMKQERINTFDPAPSPPTSPNQRSMQIPRNVLQNRSARTQLGEDAHSGDTVPTTLEDKGHVTPRPLPASSSPASAFDFAVR